MKLSICIPVLNSHEIVRRQVLHYDKMGLPDFEVVIADDGSRPPLLNYGSRIVKIFPTHDYRPWTQPLARNFAARHASGKYLLMTDIDHIIPREAVVAALDFTGDKMRFVREMGVLDENGDLTQDMGVLRSYGLTESRIAERGVKLPPHSTHFLMRADIFWRLGGYKTDLDRYPHREDAHLKRRWKKLVAQGEAVDSEQRPVIYMFPNGRFCGDDDANPLGLFHGLSRTKY